MNYTVYEIMPDGKKFFRFESNDRFDCEVYINNHCYDYNVMRANSALVIEE